MPHELLPVFGAGSVPILQNGADKFMLSTKMGRLNHGYEEGGVKEEENKKRRLNERNIC